ncbi:MFS general substrate transporter [Trichodelitschia bisporula]|uniref:MFS general substrate transporter n=1 Tax=Trichodelitschia bisporula TaxID=703511 RepID=A0A6G1HVS3_9PEZI|nr:MFS general substrate transporter [Trichodelitschia bisporula]
MMEAAEEKRVLGENEASSEASEVDHHLEAKLIRKLDIRIIPLTMLLYLFSFLDRVNIGNARLYGLEKDLGLKGNQYQTAVSLLFVTYVLCELPSNLVIKKFTPSRWIAFLCTGWGIVATLTGLVQSYAGLIVCRLILGALEAGLFPGLAIYLTMFYTKSEIALRVSYLFVSAAIAGACGGLLAYAIGHMDGVAEQSGWRWIMIIEGLPCIVLGIATWFIFADTPESASYLTPAEKALLAAKRARDPGQTPSAQAFHWADVRAGLTDWKIYAFCVAQFGADTMLYGYSTFLPTIIHGIAPHWSSALVQVLTIPCYATGALTYLAVAWWSDRTQRRGLPCVLVGVASLVGYAILISDVPSGAHYAGCFLVALGLYVVVGIPLAWLPANNPRYGKRTTAGGLQLTFGNAAGIMAPFLYPSSEGPRYVRGHSVTLALVAFAMIVYGGMSAWFSAANHRRRERGVEEKYAGLTREELDEMGDKSPWFVYTV